MVLSMSRRFFSVIGIKGIDSPAVFERTVRNVSDENLKNGRFKVKLFL
jgi:hypothetical protein